MKKRILFLTIAFTLVFGSSVFANVQLKVQNPGFEEVKAGKAAFWTTHSWDVSVGTAVFDVDSKIFHSGTKSISITNTKSNDSRYEQALKVDSNSYYKFSCWIKTDNVGTKGKGANISVEGILDTSNAITGTSGIWKESILYGKTIPNQKSLILSVGIGGYGSINTGKAWFDDIKAEKIDKAPAGVYIAPLGQIAATSQSSNQTQSVDVTSILVFAFIGVVIIIAVITLILNMKKKKSEKVEEMTDEGLDSDKTEDKEEVTESDEKQSDE